MLQMSSGNRRDRNDRKWPIDHVWKNDINKYTAIIIRWYLFNGIFKLKSDFRWLVACSSVIHIYIYMYRFYVVYLQICNYLSAFVLNIWNNHILIPLLKHVEFTREIKTHLVNVCTILLLLLLFYEIMFYSSWVYWLLRMPTE